MDDPDRIQAYMGHFPHGGTSDYLLDHVGQIFLKENVQSYDNNLLRETVAERFVKRGDDNDNLIRYGSKLPPEVNFTSLTESKMPIHIFSAGQDQWSDTVDT